MTHEFKHPNYYKELRKRNKSDQAISSEAHDGERERASDPGLKPKGTSYPSDKLPSAQAGSNKHPNPEPKAQASSQSQQAQESDDQGTSAQAHDQVYKQQG